MYYHDGKSNKESVSNKIFDITDLMARAHNLAHTDAALSQAVLGVCRHALEPLQYDLRIVETQQEIEKGKRVQQMFAKQF